MGYDAETPRLWLERVEEVKHLEDFHDLWGSAENLYWSPRAPMQTLAHSSEWIKESLTSLNPKIDKYAIILKSSVESGGNPKMIGLVGTKDPGDEIVYMLNHPYWRQGYMSEAIVAFAGPEGIFWKLENRKHINSLMADIDTENFNSVKTIKRIGGREGETTMKCYGLYRDKGPDGVVPEEKKRGFTRWYVDRLSVKQP